MDRLVKAMLRAAHVPEWAHVRHCAVEVRLVAVRNLLMPLVCHTQMDPFKFVFVQRVFESPAMDVYDNDRVMEDSLEVDWKRMLSKTTWRSKLLQACDQDHRKVRGCVVTLTLSTHSAC